MHLSTFVIQPFREYIVLFLFNLENFNFKIQGCNLGPRSPLSSKTISFQILRLYVEAFSVANGTHRQNVNYTVPRLILRVFFSALISSLFWYPMFTTRYDVPRTVVAQLIECIAGGSLIFDKMEMQSFFFAP